MSDLTVTNADLWSALVPVAPLTEAPILTLANLDLPGIASYAIKKLKRKIIEEHADLDAVRVGLVQKYAAKGPDGNPVPTDDGRGIVLENPVEFSVEFQKVLAQSVTLTGCRPVALSELGDVKISANVLDALHAFVVESTE